MENIPLARVPVKCAVTLDQFMFLHLLYREQNAKKGQQKEISLKETVKTRGLFVRIKQKIRPKDCLLFYLEKCGYILLIGD
jgi:hypothetical protein